MGLLDALKSALGIGSSRDTEPDASSERAVKEPAEVADPASQVDADEKNEDAGTADDGVTDAEAAAHTEGSAAITEEPPEDGAAEPAEAAGAVTDQPGAERDAAEPAEAAGPVPEEPEDGHEHVESISGIGPAYAKRLGDAGVKSVAQLADADPDALADETGVSAKRIGRWIERAEEY